MTHYDDDDDDNGVYVVTRPPNAGDQLNTELKGIRDELTRIKKDISLIYNKIRLGPKPLSWIVSFFEDKKEAIGVGQAVELILKELDLEFNHVNAEWTLKKKKRGKK